MDESLELHRQVRQTSESDELSGKSEKSRKIALVELQYLDQTGVIRFKWHHLGFHLLTASISSPCDDTAGG